MNKVQEVSIDLYKQFKDIQIKLDGYQCDPYPEDKLVEKKKSILDEVQVILKITGKGDLLDWIKSEGKINAL